MHVAFRNRGLFIYIVDMSIVQEHLMFLILCQGDLVMHALTFHTSSTLRGKLTLVFHPCQPGVSASLGWNCSGISSSMIKLQESVHWGG